MNSNSNTNKRAIELSKILKDEQEWLGTRKEHSHQSTLIIVSLELPAKVVRLENVGPSEDHSLSGNSTTVIPDTQYVHMSEEGRGDERKGSRFALRYSQHSLMRTLHSHRAELAKTVKFIGWPGIHVNREDEKEEIRELLETIDCVPVFPPEVEFKSFNEFCQLFMWPLFHNVLNPEELSNAPFDHEQWRRYHQMNMLWSSVITPNVSPEHMDMVWINDYHLLLLCQYLTRRVKGVNIGLFLHIPFPSFEIFRCLPVREELLRSILMADLVGFHFFPYAKQFLSSCKRLLGLDHHFKPGGLIGIDKTTASCRSSKANSCPDSELNKQETVVRIGHVHIQCDDILQSIASNPEILKRSQGIRDRYRGHYIFVSIDRLDQLSGLQLKLKAFDNFLQNYPYIKTEQPVVLIQYIFPTNTLTLEKRDRLIQSLASLSSEINLKHSNSESFGSPVIELKYGPVTQEEKYSLFLSGNCLFDTSVRDGLNLNPFEYIVCKDDSLTLPNGPVCVSSSLGCKAFSGDGERTCIVSGPFCRLGGSFGPPSLIISEFTGCSNTLSSPYRVNPWNMMNVVETLDRAVCHQKGLFQQKRHHWNIDRSYLLSHSTVNWAKEFIMDLRILSERKKKDMLRFYNTTFGIGPSLMDIRINLNSQHLSLNLLSRVYRKAEKVRGGFRLFLLDNEGTLTPDLRHFSDRRISSSSSWRRSGAIDGSGKESKGGGRGADREERVSSLSPGLSKCCNCGCDDFGCGADIRKETEEVLGCRLSDSGVRVAQADPAESGPDALLSSPLQLSRRPSFSSSPSCDSPHSRSRHENAFAAVNSNCTSIEALHLEGPSSVAISSTSNDCLEAEEEKGVGNGDGYGERLLLDARQGGGEERGCEYELEELYPESETSRGPPAQVVEALRKLCSSPNNLVVIFSGREKHLLDEWFGDIDNIGLCAEHGYYLKLPKSLDPAHPNTWRQLDIDSVNQDTHSLASCCPSPSRYRPLSGRACSETPCSAGQGEECDQSSCVLLPTPSEQQLQNVSDWKNIALQLMEQYVLRTQGSYIENKGTALVFQFKYCEPYFGAWQAKELSNYLNELLISFPVNVISGNDYVEVRLQGIDKGVAVQAILDQVSSQQESELVNKKKLRSPPPLEMILCIGDGRSDEDMFSAVNRFSRSNKPSRSPEDAAAPEDKSDGPPECQVFNVVIGKHASLANYFLHSTEEVSDLLQTLALFT